MPQPLVRGLRPPERSPLMADEGRDDRRMLSVVVAEWGRRCAVRLGVGGRTPPKHRLWMAGA